MPLAFHMYRIICKI